MAIFSLYTLFSLLTFTFTSAFDPIENHLIDCGSHTPSTVDLFHRRFISDSVPDSPLLSSSRTIQLTDPSPSQGSSPLYHTARAFTRPSKYTFAVKERGSHFLVRLHFHRFDFANCDSLHVQFHVLANGFVLLKDYKGGEAGDSGVVKDFIIWVDSDQLEIMFVPLDKSNFAFVNAIEVISAPKDLVPDVAQYVSSEKNEKVRFLRNGFEVMHRVNVGGPKVTPFNDSLWRTWIPDNEFLTSGDLASRVVYTGRIMYRPFGASREVGPDNVYSSARVIKSINDQVPRSRLTWEFPVSEGYKYLVRMHFCDIASKSLYMLYFNVYLNGNLAYENLDLSSITYGRLASPFYADFIVDRGSAGVLTVSVAPSNNSSPHAVDALLNGVEVMKMNNSMRSFDGEACVGSILKSWEGHSVGYIYPLMAAVFMLLVGSVIVQRRGTQLRDSVSWSPIPADVSDIFTKHGNQLSSGKV